MLSSKVAQLRAEAERARRLADFWERGIAFYGEEKTTAFYTHLGLNHLEKKSYDWEGLTLSREPKEHEKLCVKGIHGAQESGKEQIAKILLEARTELISDGLVGIKKLPIAQYHELTLSVSSETRTSLRDRLITVYSKGRKLVATELGHTKSAKATDDEEFDELDDLVDLTDARVANEIQARIASAASRYTLLGLTGKALWEAVEKEVGEGSTGWLDRAATGVTNKTLSIGRGDEAESRKDEWQTVEYSAILDSNVCPPCSADDGQTSNDEALLTPAPNPDCAGGDWCRCFHVWISD